MLVCVLAMPFAHTSGTAQVFGCDVVGDRSSNRCLLGYLPQEFRTYPELIDQEFLMYILS